MASLLDRDLTYEFMCDAAEAGADVGELKRAAGVALAHAKQPLAARRSDRSYAIERRWYASLDAGEPDWSVYDDLEYVADAWACWLVYSRKYLRSVRQEKAPPIGGVKRHLGVVRSVIDLGCGLGYTTAALCELFPLARVTGTNLEGIQARIAREVGRRYGFRVAPDLSGPGELIFASEFFEHLPEPVAYLRHVVETCEPRALLLASTFNQPSIGHFPTYSVDGEQLDGRATSRRFGAELRRLGYRRVPTKFWNGRPSYWTRNRSPES